MGLFKRPSGASPPHPTPSSTLASPLRSAFSSSSTGASTAPPCAGPTSMPAALRSPPPIAASTAPAVSAPSTTPSRRPLRTRTTSHSQGHSIIGANISYPSSPLAFEHLPPSPLPHVAAATPSPVPAASVTPKRVRLKSGGVSFQQIVPLTPLSPSTPAGRLTQGKIAAGPPESPKTPLQQQRMVQSSQQPVGNAAAFATRHRQRTNDTPRLITRKAPPSFTPFTPSAAVIAPLESLSRSRTATSSTSTSSSSAGHAYRGFANSLPRPKMVRRASSMDDIRTPIKLEKKRAQTQSISVHSAPHSRAASTQARSLAPPALPFMTKLGSGSPISSTSMAAAPASESTPSYEQRRRQRTLTCGQPSLSGMAPPSLSGSDGSSVTSSPVLSQMAKCEDLALPLVLQSTAAKDLEEMYTWPVLPQGPLFTTDFFYPSSPAGSPEFAQLARFPSSTYYTNDKTLIYAASAVKTTLAPPAPSTNLAKFDYAPSSTSTMSDVERLTSATRFAGMGYTSSRGQMSRNASATSSANGSYGSSHPSSPGSLSPNRSRKTSKEGKLGAFSSASSNASSSFTREQDSWRAFLDYDRSPETSVEDAKVAKEDKKPVLALELIDQAGASKSLAKLPIDTETVLTLKGDKALLEGLNVTVVRADTDGEAVWEIRIGRSVPDKKSITPVELNSDKCSQVSVPSPTPFSYASSVAASTTDCTSPPSSAPSTPSLQITAAMELAGSYFMPLSPPQTALKTPKKTALPARQAFDEPAEAALEVGTLPSWSIASAKAAVGKRSRQSSTRTTRASVGARSRQTTMATHGSYGSTPASPTVALSTHDLEEGRARHAEHAAKAHLAAKAKLELLSLWSARAYSSPPDAPESDADDGFEQSLEVTDDEDSTADILRHYRGTASPALGRSVPSPRTWRFRDASTNHNAGGHHVHDKVFEADELSLVGRQGWSETEPETETDFDADTDAEVSVA